MGVWVIILILVIIIGIYVWGIIFEYEYPYILLLRKLTKLKFSNGENILEYLKKKLPKVEQNKRWHRCSYDSPQDLSKEIILVILQGKTYKENSTFAHYRFFYNTRKNEVFPAFVESWDKFAENWKETELLEVKSPRGEDLKIPVHWGYKKS